MNLFRHHTRQLLKDLFQLSHCKPCLRSQTTHASSGQLPVDRHFEDLKVDHFQELIVNNDDNEKVDKILNEYEYEKYTTLRAPTTLSINDMTDLMTMNEAKDRKRFFNFLYTKEIERSKTRRKRKEISHKYWTEKNEIYSNFDCGRTGIWDNNQKLVYGLWHNTLVSKIQAKSIGRLRNDRLRRTALFGQKLVVDLSFDKYMKLDENRLLLKQINILYNYNKYKAIDPFDLHFTNCDPDSVFMKEIHRFIPNYNSPKFMVSLHRQSYLDVFPRQQLVYLSPHAKQSLKEVDEDMIYVIGGLIDKSFRQPITFVNAEVAGIKSYRLPIDENILWRSGSKSLCLNHIIAILHDVKLTGDWRQALKDNIPQRKQKTVEEIELEDMLRRQRFNRQLKKNLNN